MKFIPFFKLCLLLSISVFFACNNQNKGDSPAHLNAVKWSQTIEDIHEDLVAKVEKFEKENKDFGEEVWNTETPDTEILRRVKNHETLIADYKGILKKQALIIEQNKAYINKHESSALGAAEIQAQHEQIYKNLLIVQEDATQIAETIDIVLALYVSLEETLTT